MTADDAFDARLRAAFAAAQPPPEDAFVERVVTRLDGAGRRRMLVIGGAGAGGSTIASTQLESIIEHVRPAADSLDWLSGGGGAMLALLTPETLAAVLIAAAVAVFAIVLPSRT